MIFFTHSKLCLHATLESTLFIRNLLIFIFTLQEHFYYSISFQLLILFFMKFEDIYSEETCEIELVITVITKGIRFL